MVKYEFVVGVDFEVANVRSHDFRRTYCTMLYDAGIDLKTAQAWMGHADEKMILKCMRI